MAFLSTSHPTITQVSVANLSVVLFHKKMLSDKVEEPTFLQGSTSLEKDINTKYNG